MYKCFGEKVNVCKQTELLLAPFHRLNRSVPEQHLGVAQAAAKQMIGRKQGTILLTGASASVKGYPNSSSFAMGTPTSLESSFNPSSFIAISTWR